MDAISLLNRARALQDVARRMGAKGDQVQREEKTNTALMKLEGALDRLETLKKTYVLAADRGIPVDATPKWDDGLDVLKDYVGRGRPTPQALTGAATKIGRLVEGGSVTLGGAWTQWCSGQLEAIPSERIPLLPLDTRSDTSDRISKLKGFARGNPDSSVILQFQNSLAIVRERLDDATASSEVHDALEKVDDGSALSQFTDAELAALRSDPALADQIILRRRT
jgi:hypothetical protein